MTLRVIAAAAPALQRLNEQTLPLRQAYTVCMNAKKLDPHLAFVQQEAAKIQSQPEKADRDAALNELLDMEVDVQLDPVELSLDADITLSPADIMRMEGFVTFK